MVFQQQRLKKRHIFSFFLIDEFWIYLSQVLLLCYYEEEIKTANSQRERKFSQTRFGLSENIHAWSASSEFRTLPTLIGLLNSSPSSGVFKTSEPQSDPDSDEESKSATSRHITVLRVVSVTHLCIVFVRQASEQSLMLAADGHQPTSNTYTLTWTLHALSKPPLKSCWQPSPLTLSLSCPCLNLLLVNKNKLIYVDFLIATFPEPFCDS